MSEYRQDAATGDWVLVAPERGRRPHLPVRRDGASLPPHLDPSCPFCPGNEWMLPGIIEEVTREAPPGWHTRVVPNRYPAVSPDDADRLPPSPIGVAVPGSGHHEVIVETARHDADLSTLPRADADAVVQTWRRRSLALMERPSVRSVVVFRNHGRPAGASLAHPHSQVIATGIVPPRLAATAEWARSSYARNGRCVVCHAMEHELANGSRVVEVTGHFLAIVPFAAMAPFEQIILPRRHQSTLGESDDTALADLGPLLQRTLRRLAAVAENPPYNLVIEAVGKDDVEAPWLHWRLRVRPDVVTPGGFELGAGLPINPSRPEDDAAALRATAISTGEQTG